MHYCTTWKRGYQHSARIQESFANSLTYLCYPNPAGHRQKKGQTKLKNCPGCVSIDLPVTLVTPPACPCSCPSFPFSILSLRSLWNLLHFASRICCNLPWHPPLCVYLLALPLPTSPCSSSPFFFLSSVSISCFFFVPPFLTFFFLFFVGGDLRAACQTPPTPTPPLPAPFCICKSLLFASQNFYRFSFCARKGKRYMTGFCLFLCRVSNLEP